MSNLVQGDRVISPTLGTGTVQNMVAGDQANVRFDSVQHSQIVNIREVTKNNPNDIPGGVPDGSGLRKGADIILKQKKHLDKLQAISKRPILIKMKEGATPEGADPDDYRWVPYMERWNKVQAPIYTRTILSNEICLDPDVKDWGVLNRLSQNPKL